MIKSEIRNNTGIIILTVREREMLSSGYDILVKIKLDEFRNNELIKTVLLLEKGIVFVRVRLAIFKRIK